MFTQSFTSLFRSMNCSVLFEFAFLYTLYIDRSVFLSGILYNSNNLLSGNKGSKSLFETYMRRDLDKNREFSCKGLFI